MREVARQSPIGSSSHLPLDTPAAVHFPRFSRCWGLDDARLPERSGTTRRVAILHGRICGMNVPLASICVCEVIHCCREHRQAAKRVRSPVTVDNLRGPTGRVMWTGRSHSQRHGLDGGLPVRVPRSPLVPQVHATACRGPAVDGSGGIECASGPPGLPPSLGFGRPGLVPSPRSTMRRQSRLMQTSAELASADFESRVRGER